ncbi:TlpA disulfide reductase family protein [Dyadobacter sp. Leaf189]|uniref:TlpA family protein disulfide reductase n=1 Tax=Dyadobacter sp. Leaf189 TaxID=1736295 RepID=UPI0006FC117D|nr:TlpA disulfide reductase family protein [Dyadobacter sp. Leaf189]KQS30628.1 hypothetical protein ASG33_09540 [Dyadobacter sp. Leaf189]
MRTNIFIQLLMFLIGHNALAGIAYISGLVAHADSGSLQCMVIAPQLQTGNVSILIPVQGGKFEHEFDITAPTFLNISDGVNYFGGFIAPGDSIYLRYDKLNFATSIVYAGVGKEKFGICYSINEIKVFARKLVVAAKMQRYPVDFAFAALDSLHDVVGKKISQSAGSMSAESTAQLRGYLAAAGLSARYNLLVAIFGDSFDNILKTQGDRLSKESVMRMQALLKFDKAFSGSRFYADAVKTVASIYLEENVQPVTADFATKKYRLLADMLPRELRDPVLYLTLKSDFANQPSVADQLVMRAAISTLENSAHRQSIENLLTGYKPLIAGDKAPDFSLENLSGEKINLSSFSGKTIYLDFWFASCGPCHMLFKAIEPVKKHFENDDRIVFLTVSIDNREVWKKAVARFGVKGLHAFTENQLRTHPIIQSYQVTAYPSTYIIDPNGKIFSTQPSQNHDILKKQLEESIRITGK